MDKAPDIEVVKARLLELLAKATPGEWALEINGKSASAVVLGRRSDGDNRASDGMGSLFEVPCALEPDAVMFSPMNAEQIANAHFAVDAKRDVPALLADHTRQAAEIARLREALGEIRDFPAIEGDPRGYNLALHALGNARSMRAIARTALQATQSTGASAL